MTPSIILLGRWRAAEAARPARSPTTKTSWARTSWAAGASWSTGTKAAPWATLTHGLKLLALLVRQKFIELGVDVLLQVAELLLLLAGQVQLILNEHRQNLAGTLPTSEAAAFSFWPARTAAGTAWAALPFTFGAARALVIAAGLTVFSL